MPITLEEPRSTGTASPVLNHRSISTDEFVGGILKFEQRQQTDADKKPKFKDNGKPAYEMVVWLLTLRSTMEAGIAGNDAVPERGQIVRAILKGKTFGTWIDEKNNLGRGVRVGDLFRMTTDIGISYRGKTAVSEFKTDEAIAEFKQSRDWVDRKVTLGMYGPVQIKAPADSDAAFVVECEQAYYELAKQTIRLEDDPFPGPASSSAAPSTEAQSDPW